MEQLLRGKYAISVATYENHGGRDSAKILNRLLSYSGAIISGTIISRKKSESSSKDNYQLSKNIHKLADKLYEDIKGKRKYIFQPIKHFIIFKIGIKPFVIKNADQYGGVINHWKSKI